MGNVETWGHVSGPIVMAHALAELRYGIVAHQHESGFKCGYISAQTLYRLTAHSAQAASERSMFTVCEQPLLPPACSVAWSPLGLRLWVRALFVRKRRVFK